MPLPRPTTLLAHHAPGGFHFDWLIDPPPRGGGPAPPLLWTARVHLPWSHWAKAGHFVALALPPHRRRYLQWSGPLSRGRGHVIHTARGQLQVHRWTDHRIVATLRAGAIALATPPQPPCRPLACPGPRLNPESRDFGLGSTPSARYPYSGVGFAASHRLIHVVTRFNRINPEYHPMAPSPPEDRDRSLLDSAIPIDAADLGEVTGQPSARKAKTAHTAGPMDDLEPIDLSNLETDPNDSSGSKITVFGYDKRSAKAEHFNRPPNLDGTGATHCKTFVAKLRLDAIDHLDEQVNAWLDAHPECEVKFVSSTVGKLVGKISEDAIFRTIWV